MRSGVQGLLAAVLVAVAFSCVAAITYTLVRRAGAPEPAALHPEPSAEVESALAAEAPDPEPVEAPVPAPEPIAETPALDAGPPSFETPPLVPPPPAATAAAAPMRVPTPAPTPQAPAQATRFSPERLRATMQEIPITMYTTTWCGHCERARRWMRAHAFRFTEHDVEASESASRAHRALNPRGGVPVIDVDGEVLVGFSEARVARALSQAAERRIR